MENPFKKLVSQEDPPQEAMKSEILNHIETKRWFFQMLEFFTAILGVTLLESITMEEAAEIRKGDIAGNQSKNEDYFF